MWPPYFGLQILTNVYVDLTTAMQMRHVSTHRGAIDAFVMTASLVMVSCVYQLVSSHFSFSLLGSSWDTSSYQLKQKIGLKYPFLAIMSRIPVNKLFMWHGILAGSLILISIIAFCLTLFLCTNMKKAAIWILFFNLCSSFTNRIQRLHYFTKWWWWWWWW